MTADVKFQCPHCQQHLSAPAEMQGAAVDCPSCRKSIQVPLPTPPGPEEAAEDGVKPLCAYCQSPFDPADAKTACPECHAGYHADCWQENGGCAVYGCSQVPQLEHRESIEIPMSYWGQEHKHCPVCTAQMLAAAVRCRICGTTFASARPLSAGEFQQQAVKQVRGPQLRKAVVWVFVLCVLPCAAPLATVFAAIWYASRRRDIQQLPSLYPALCKIGLVVGAGQTAIIVIALVIAAARNG